MDLAAANDSPWTPIALVGFYTNCDTFCLPNATGSDLILHPNASYPRPISSSGDSRPFNYNKTDREGDELLIPLLPWRIPEREPVRGGQLSKHFQFP